jgi:rod shape-determining protein MreC
MLQQFKSRSYFLSVAGLLAVSIQLTSLSIKYPELPSAGWSLVERFILPLRKLNHEFFETGSYVWEHYIALQNIALEREVLSLQIDELKKKNIVLTELEHENERLRSILNYRKSDTHEGIVASVIGRDPSNWLKTLTINKGSNHGIRPGMPVMSGEGVVGQTASVGSKSTTILLLNDSASSVGAMLQNDRSVGMAEGIFKSDLLRLNYVENIQGEILTVGENVITSGLDGVFPKGLLIGTVSEVSEGGSLFRDITVVPSVDLRRIETVVVLSSK